MTSVIDASVLVALLVDSGLEGKWAESAIDQDLLVAPELALAEATNILRRLERRTELSRVEATTAHADLLRLDIELFPFAPFAERTWTLRGSLTSYDAWSVAIAEGLDCPLLTLDHRPSRARGHTCRIITPPSSLR